MFIGLLWFLMFDRCFVIDYFRGEMVDEDVFEWYLGFWYFGFVYSLLYLVS